MTTLPATLTTVADLIRTHDLPLMTMSASPEGRATVYVGSVGDFRRWSALWDAPVRRQEVGFANPADPGDLSPFVAYTVDAGDIYVQLFDRDEAARLIRQRRRVSSRGAVRAA